MKNRKFLLMAAMMLSLSLTACGGKPAESSKAPQSNTPSAEPSVAPSSQAPAPSSQAPAPSSQAPAPSSQAPAPSSQAPAPSSQAPAPSSQAPAPSSEAPSSQAPAEKAVAVSSVDVVAKESKVYLQIKGTATAYTSAEFKWALALSSTDNNGTASEDFILGTSATFEEADYKLDATLNNDGSYVFEYNLSDIALMKAGLFTIHAGVKGLAANLDVGNQSLATPVKDGVNKYYIRPDVGSKNTIAVDALPPVDITEVSIITDADTGKIYAKIGGEAPANITQEVLDGYDTFIQFQKLDAWSNTRLTKLDGTGDYHFYWKKEGSKAFLYADVSFFTGAWDQESSGNTTHHDSSMYNTHLNVTENKQADAKLDVALDAHFKVTNSAGNLIDINVISRPGQSGAENIYGNLGFIVTDAAE